MSSSHPSTRPERSIFGAYEALIERNIANGADGLIVCGSTGEFYTMTVEERVALFAATVKAAAGRVPVLAGVSDLRTDIVTALCRKAEDAGCDGILALPPIYAVPDEREVDHFYGQVAGASGLPVMLYNSPRRIGLNLTPDQVERLAALPTVASIKDSSGDIVQVTELCRRVGGRLSVFVGYETMIRAALPVGVVGVVAWRTSSRDGSCGPTSTPAPRRLCHRRPPGAGALRDLPLLPHGSYYAGIKATMNALGQPVGSPREPLLPFTDAQQAKVAAILADAKVADLIASLR